MKEYIKEVGMCEVTIPSASVALGMTYTVLVKPEDEECFTFPFRYDAKASYEPNTLEAKAAQLWADRFLGRLKVGTPGTWHETIPVSRSMLLRRVLRSVSAGEVRYEDAADFLEREIL